MCKNEKKEALTKRHNKSVANQLKTYNFLCQYIVKKDLFCSKHASKL